MIKAIVFDYGNVISESQDSSCYAKMASLSGLTETFFMSAFWKYRAAFDRGTIRGREMYRDVLAEGGVTGTDAELNDLADRLLFEDIKSWSRVSPTVTEWARALQAEGYKIGILSNMPFDFLDAYEHKIELFAKADTVIFSCNLGLVKPEPAIYQKLLDTLGCKAEETVFFDDLPINIEGALKSGIRGFLWTGIDQAKKDLAEIIRKS